MPFQDRATVPGICTVHRSNNTEVINNLGEVGKQFADPGTAFTVLPESPGTTKQTAQLLGEGQDTWQGGTGQLLTTVTVKHRLVVKGIHV
jgi:hypothetical protein